VPGFDQNYNKPFGEEVYNQQYKPVVTTTTTIEGAEPNINIEFINIQDRQIFSNDIELRVRINSNFKIEEKTLFVNNMYFGELTSFNDNVFGIKIPKESLSEESELRIRVMDEHLNIFEKAINVVVN